MIRGSRIALAAAVVFLTACSAASRRDQADARPGEGAVGPVSRADADAAPAAGAGSNAGAASGRPEAYDELTPGPPVTTPILDLYEPIGFYEVRPLHTSRADYSGLTVKGADSSGVTLWLVNDKATRVEDAVYALDLAFPAAMDSTPVPVTPVPVTPRRLPVLNPRFLPTGEDIEDLGRVEADGDRPAVVFAAGERGPSDAPVSWTYLMLERGDSLELIRSAQGSPAGETVNNDGFEGAAVRRLADGRIETFACKERPAPTYILRDRFAWDGTDYVHAAGPDSLTLTAVGSQSAACVAGSGGQLWIVDRAERRIAVVDIASGDPAADGGRLDGRVRRWIRYAAVDQMLEGRGDDTPASLYGAVEAVSEDALGRIYLMTDNNESGNSRLMVFRRR